jgi:hypothetical protein
MTPDRLISALYSSSTARTSGGSRSKFAMQPWQASCGRPTWVRLNEHLEHPEGAVVFQHACKMGLEGIVSKQLGSRFYFNGFARDG